MDNELQIIINAAFIYESCPQRRRYADYRKEKLQIKLKAYIDKQLSLNARPLESEISAGLGTGGIRPD